MNVKLFYSSSIFGLFQIIYLCYNITPIEYTILIFSGVSLSILNHKFTSKIIKFFDRLCMIIGIIIDMYFIMILNNIYKEFYYQLLFISIFLYILSKLKKKTSYHFYSHISISLLHIFLIQNFNKNCRVGDNQNIICDFNDL